VDQPYLWVIIAVALAAVLLAVYSLRNKARVKGTVTGPLGFGASVEADDHNAGGQIGMEGVKAKKGSVEATTGTGGSIGMKNVEAGQDVRARTDSEHRKN
jgi:hypothetical protein